MQKASIKERVVATFAAIILLALVPLPFLVELAGAGLLFFACSRFGLTYASQHTLRMLDLTITFTVVHFVIYLLQMSLLLVVEDAGLTLPLVNDGRGRFILKTLVTTVYLLFMFGFFICALRGCELKTRLSMGMLEALRGRRVRYDAQV